MRYGYFDEEKKEYVITRPDTPAPWVNYLGSPEYGAIVSNNAGGYSFAKSGANGRILRYIFNQFDQPGRYISGIMTQKIIGQHPGSRLAKISVSIKVNVIMAQPILK